MDRAQQLTYEKDFRIAFLESKGNEFQSLFEKLMLRAYPGDFMPCRPWGNVGDKKNDGYLPSKRALFQCYAPNEMNAKEAVKKIKEDFDGAKIHWKKYFDTWFFVHNAQDGLGPHIIETIEELRRANPEITIVPCGYIELLVEFRRLSLQDLESWFGLSLTVAVNLGLGYEDLAAVLKHINSSLPPTSAEVKDVSRGKLEANLLSPVVADFLKIGMQKSHLVSGFFQSWNDPMYGERIASAFRKEYIALKTMVPTLHPDEVFGRLEAWAGGSLNNTPTHKAAVLAVMAYFFDRCEIFEDAGSIRPV